MRLPPLVVLGTLLLLAAIQPCLATDNQLTPEEKTAGWQLLFNGKDYTGWICSNGKKIASPVEDGALVPYKSGGYIVVYQKDFSDFILKCDVKMGEQCNSGVFLRVSDLKRPVQNGFEIQVYNGKGTSYHDFGAIYDLVRPKKQLAKGPGQWTSMQVTCRGPYISVSVNGETVAEMNCDDFTEPGLRPDGTKHKFRRAVQDFARKGHLGFQDHGHKVWFKNVKLLELKAK